MRYTNNEDVTNPLVHCPYFITDYLPLTKDFSKDLSADDSFHIYMCVKGEGSISDGEVALPIRQGETVLFPASCNKLVVKTKGIDLLEVRI